MNLTVLSMQEDSENYQFHVDAPEPSTCPTCGIGPIVKFGKQDQSYRDLPIHGKRVTLWLQRRRYRCNGCMTTFRPDLADMDDSRKMTKRLITYVEKAVLQRTNTAVANECGLHEKTVRELFANYTARMQETLQFLTPRVLGIDEIYMQRQFRCVLTNIEQQTVLDLLPDRQLVNVERYLAHLPNKEQVEVLCMDMYKNYAEAARRFIPQALPVIDKFHVVKKANEAMEEARKRIKKGLGDYDRRMLKNDRKLMLMRERDLSPLDKLTVGNWFDRYPALAAAYRSKEVFFDIYLATSQKEAQERFEAWKGDLPPGQAPFATLAGMVGRWHAPIFNYFRPGLQFTNAFTEGANRKMKDLNRETRGMSFEAFRAKVLFAAQHKVVQIKVPKVSPFSGAGGRAGTAGWMIPTKPEFDVYNVDLGIPISTVQDFLYEAGPAEISTD
ncbi:ISL3 family transposase [Acidovorax sp. NCPPB 2350]|nr:ISL3 family transposase [Acidovorax sp. NCPPB 2350]